MARIDLANLFVRARDSGAETLVRLLREAEDRLLGLLQQERLPDGRHRFVRGGHYARTLITKLGRVMIEVGRVYDRLRNRTFSPLLMALRLGKRRYTHDLRLTCAEEATRTSYGEASEAIQRSLNLIVPRRTIWNFVQELASWVRLGMRRVPLAETESATVTDSTFVRGWRRGLQHEVSVAIRQRASDHRLEMMAAAVDAPPRSVLGSEGMDRLVTDDASVYSVTEARWHQLCHLHFLRRMRELLTEEKGLIDLGERMAVLEELVGLLAHLRASVAKHTVDHDRVAITYRVEATLRRFGEIGHRLEGRGLFQAARYVRERGRATVVFAEVAARGGWMPATSNGVERVMGMIAHRCKRRWAHWNGGLRNLLDLLLVRKTRPASYGWALRTYMRAGAVGLSAPVSGPVVNKS